MADTGDKVIAHEGDTLCGLALAAGYADCKPLRAAAENAGKSFLKGPLKPGDEVFVPRIDPRPIPKPDKKKHKFKRKLADFAIRFVHGSKSLPYAKDPTLTRLNVSNFPPDKGGADRTGSFPGPDKTSFDESADADPDAFKIEVRDATHKTGDLTVKLEALRPIYSKSGRVLRHEQFPTAGNERRERSMESAAKRVSKVKKMISRTPYIRLVVDTQDRDALPNQALLVTHMVNTNKSRIEILDQMVRARYELPTCKETGDKKCAISAELPVGPDVTDKKRVKVAVHVLRRSRTGSGVCTTGAARRKVLAYCRELYAQSNLSVRIVTGPRHVPPPENLIAVSNNDGLKAAGGGKVTLKIKVTEGDGAAAKSVEKEVELASKANRLPSTTAKRLAEAINNAFSGSNPVVTARRSDNPPLGGKTRGSSDVIVGNPVKQAITIQILENSDTDQKVQIGRPTTVIHEFGQDGQDTHVGTLDERTLVKNYDTGSDRIDYFIVKELDDGSYGEAFRPRLPEAKAGRPIGSMVNSAISEAKIIKEANHVHTSMPHEFGHILMDCTHAAEPREMMCSGSDTLTGEDRRPINGPKRISDPASAAHHMAFNNGATFNPTEQIRTRNPDLIDAW